MNSKCYEVPDMRQMKYLTNEQQCNVVWVNFSISFFPSQHSEKIEFVFRIKMQICFFVFSLRYR